MQKEVYILSAVRTALGTFGGAFAGISATKLGAAAIKGAVEKAGINPEEALEKTNKKFIRRFRYMEDRINEKGEKLDDLNLEQMDVYWNEAKKLGL